MAIDIKPTDVILLEDERDKQKMQIMQLEHVKRLWKHAKMRSRIHNIVRKTEYEKLLKISKRC